MGGTRNSISSNIDLKYEGDICAELMEYYLLHSDHVRKEVFWGDGGMGGWRWVLSGQRGLHGWVGRLVCEKDVKNMLGLMEGIKPSRC